MEKKTQSTCKKVKVNTRNRVKIEMFFAKINGNNNKHNDTKPTGK
jgi:hypothetical protein